MTVPPDTRYTLHGRVVDARSGDGVAGLSVEAFDYDAGRPGQRLGATMTGDDGQFELPFQQKDAGGRSEGAPEPYVVVRSPDGVLLHQTPWVRLDPGATYDVGAVRVARRDYDPGGADGGPEDTDAPIGGEPGATPGTAPEPNDPSSEPGSATDHGRKTREYVAPRSPFYRGPFGRLFRELPAWVPPGRTDDDKAAVLRALAADMVETDGDTAEGDNLGVPAAYTYFGQFVDHDVTFDPASSLTKQNDPERLVNFRSPAFDLDNLYGGGPDDDPFLYDRRRPGRFLLGKGRHQRGGDAEVDLCALPKTDEDDLPRNEQGRALIGDPRNDENLVVAQLQLAFLRFHNRVMDLVERPAAEGGLGLTGREAFFRAQQLVRWHYQWVVLFDFLPRVVGRDMVDAVVTRNQDLADAGDGAGGPYDFHLRYYRPKEAPFMPVEFSVAAYRFGHSLVRADYDLNRVVRRVPVFRPPSSNPGPLADLRGGRPLPGLWSLDWRRFLELGGGAPQWARRTDTELSRALAAIPSGPGVENPLALLNLVRGWRLGLPSGQAVARAMGAPALPNDEIGLDPDRLGHEAPLWYYVLAEADHFHGGNHLGPVGGRIVAEVFVGLAKADPSSFFNQAPTWTPETATERGPLLDPLGDGFQLRDVVRFAGLDGDPF